jgi:hypothetical protein
VPVPLSVSVCLCLSDVRVRRWMQKDSFVEDLWKLFDFNADGAISREEYRRGCLAHPELIAQLGLGRTPLPIATHAQTDRGVGVPGQRG